MYFNIENFYQKTYIINYNTSEGEKYMIARFITKKTRTCRNKLSSPEKS